MKLSDYKGEEALEVLANLIEPAAEIMADKEVAEAAKTKSKAKAISVAIKNHKKSVIEILAALEKADPNTYEVSLLTLPIKLAEILSDKELMSLFTFQGQTGGANSSGSASVITEE